jgi:hypothetical protein
MGLGSPKSVQHHESKFKYFRYALLSILTPGLEMASFVHFTRHAPESKHQYVDGFP